MCACVLAWARACSRGRAHPERHGVGDAKVGYVACPEGPEVRVKTDLAAAIPETERGRAGGCSVAK
eukprot:3261705-Pleurochrysis_carterae.AAC.2